MRTGTKVSLTATSCPGRTVQWWFGTMEADGATCHATTTCHTPARRAPVSFPCLNLYNISLREVLCPDYNNMCFLQRPVGTPLGFPMLRCTGRSGCVMRPTAGCGTTARKALCRNWILLLHVCPVVSGRSLRLPACQVSFSHTPAFNIFILLEKHLRPH